MKKQSFILGGATIVIFIISLIFWFSFDKSITRRHPSDLQPSTPPLEGNTEPSFPIEINGFPATVISKGENYLILETYGKQGLRHEVEVFVVPDTIIRKILLIKPATENDPGEEEIKRISFSEIKIGDRVLVSARESIAEKNEFEAAIINIIEKTY